MVQRLQSYGREEIVPENTTLYTQGERDTDMFVVLEGELDVCYIAECGLKVLLASTISGEPSAALRMLPEIKFASSTTNMSVSRSPCVYRVVFSGTISSRP